MAKATGKRKSESAAPTGKSKHRKLFQDSDSNAEEGSSDDLFVSEVASAPKYIKKSKPKSRKSEPVLLKRVDDEYEEDEGRMESQQFLALVQTQVQKKKAREKATSEFLVRFNEKLESDDEGLREHRRGLAVASDKLTQDFLTTFQTIYALSRPQPPPPKPTLKGKEPAIPQTHFSLLYTCTKNLTSIAHSLINKFNDLNTKTTTLVPANLLINNWEQQNEATDRVLSIGHQYGLEKYQAMVMGGKMPGVEGEDVVFIEAVYGDLEGMEEEGRMTWGRSMGKLRKVAKKGLRALPPIAAVVEADEVER